MRFCTFVLALILASPLGAFERLATPQAGKLGVARYEVEQLPTEELRAVIFSATEDRIGTLTVRSSDGNVAFAYEPVDGEWFTVIWDPRQPLLILEPTRGTALTARFDRKRQRWTGDTQAVMRRFGKALQIVGAVAADLNGMNRGLRAAPSGVQIPVYQDPCAGDPLCGPAGGPVCNGFLEHGNGNAIARSQACAQARNEVNIKCWNQYCIGCCQWFDCDAYCVAGDFWCAAVVFGRSCSRSSLP